jgi:methyl-accepting chemotaxis protein
MADFDFDTAIAAHRDWKVKLRKAIADKEQLDAEDLPRRPMPAGPVGARPGRRTLEQQAGVRGPDDTHAEFHQTAGAVARKINAGQYSDAERLIGSGSASSRSRCGGSDQRLQRNRRVAGHLGAGLLPVSSSLRAAM